MRIATACEWADLYNLDDSGPQLKALLLRTLSLEERGRGGSKSKSKSTLDDVDDDQASSSAIDAIALARAILSAAGDDLAVLNVLLTVPKAARGVQSTPITAHSPMSEVKKVYRFIAAQVHPDKLQRKFEKATQG
jgi:hypothetical protein